VASLLDRLQARVTAHLPLPVRTSDWRAIKALLEPADIAAYAGLLPRALGMPSRPLVLIEFAEVSPTWHEGIVSVACRCGDTEGWHGLYWAIDSYFPYAFGRLVGYPKFMADGMTLTRATSGWRGDVVHAGRRALSVAFTPRDEAGVPSDGASLLANIGGPAAERPYFLQVPAGRGPWLNQLAFTERVSCPMRERVGRVVVSVDVDEAWARLFAGGQGAGLAKALETTGTGFGWLTSRRVGTRT